MRIHSFSVSRGGALAAAAATAWLACAGAAQAFCGFYVSKADGELFNEASKVAMIRDGQRTVVTMANDFRGKAEEFAVVIPTPTVLEREQIHVAENALMDRLDAFTAPRLVEYFDEDPCVERALALDGVASSRAAAPAEAEVSREDRAKTLGVTIEAEYTVGEYDILILSAKESDGLQTWLDESGYKTPEKARAVLASYIRQDMKFFVAKVNLKEQAKIGASYLRPIQIAYESPKFMLPIRLGTVNAKGSQDLLLFALTRSGRVETANYRTARIPTDIEIPLYVQNKFGDFYQAMFARSVEREGGRAVLTEYAWDMNWCDPCAADPLTVSELRGLGVFWLGEDGASKGGAQNVFVTRLHVRYDAERFPEDLRLMETGDRRNFQGRYITRHPFAGESSCPAGQRYLRALGQRYEKQASTLANLTGWDIGEIRAEMAANGESAPEGAGQQDQKGPKWWKGIWKDG